MSLGTNVNVEKKKKTLTVLYGPISDTSAELRQQKPGDRKAYVVLGRQAD